MAQPLSVTFLLRSLFDLFCYLGGNGRLEALLVPRDHGGWAVPKSQLPSMPLKLGFVLAPGH